jgi:hypothetical protein
VAGAVTAPAVAETRSADERQRTRRYASSVGSVGSRSGVQLRVEPVDRQGVRVSAALLAGTYIAYAGPNKESLVGAFTQSILNRGLSRVARGTVAKTPRAGDAFSNEAVKECNTYVNSITQPTWGCLQQHPDACGGIACRGMWRGGHNRRHLAAPCCSIEARARRATQPGRRSRTTARGGPSEGGEIRAFTRIGPSPRKSTMEPRDSGDRGAERSALRVHGRQP